jgi:hypothetical protein
MIEVVSEVLASRNVAGRAQGEIERGWQDKSADGCRALVVGWMGIFVTVSLQQAGSFFKMNNSINGATASRPRKGNAIP